MAMNEELTFLMSLVTFYDLCLKEKPTSCTMHGPIIMFVDIFLICCRTESPRLPRIMRAQLKNVNLDIQQCCAKLCQSNDHLP